MTKRNYSKMSKKPAIEPVVEQVVEETTETHTEPVIGKVVKCGKLNVRKEPHISADIVCEVALDSELMIDLDKSTDEWFSVCTAAGSDGFCMKKFVDLR